MNIYLAFTLFSVMILVYWIVSEIFTMLFRFMGLPDEKARFQVMSLLTGCGFTTHESEMFISSRSRRRLVRVTMLFGYVFNVTIVSAFVNVFLSMKITEIGHDLAGMVIPLVAASVIVIFMRIPAVRSWGDRFITRIAGRIVHETAANSVMILDYIGGGTIASVSLKQVPEAFRGMDLETIDMRNRFHLLIMLVERGGNAEAARADTVLLEGDKLTVFGEYPRICEAFEAQERFSDEENS